MHAILQAISGPSVGVRIIVRQGQVVHIGRTAWADYSLPADSALADRHFAIEYDHRGCRIRDLNSASGVMVNGAQVTLGPIHTGDEIAAGQTTFAVFVEGEAELNPNEPMSDDGIGQGRAAGITSGPTAADYCEFVDLSEGAQAFLQPLMTPPAFLELLIAEKQFSDAIRFLAFWLPKPMAVSWGCHCVREVMGDQMLVSDRQALESAQTWAGDPVEENRRAAGAAAEANQPPSAANWVALGAFWSGGSLTPPELPPVPPGETLTAQAITAALLIAAPLGNPLQAAARYQSFLAHGQVLVTAGGSLDQTK